MIRTRGFARDHASVARARPGSRTAAACLLATTSALAIGTGNAAAQVVTNPPTPFTNSGAINQLIFNDGATHVGSVTNASSGQINFAGTGGAAVLVNNATTIQGDIVNNGAIRSALSGAPSGLLKGIDTSGGTVGNITNAGSIMLTSGSGGAVALQTGPAASVTNSGTISVAGTFGANNLGVVLGNLSGGFLNSGTLSVTATGSSGFLTGLATGISLNGTVHGSIVNTGTINLAGTPGSGLAIFYIAGAGSPLGGFRNDGTITESAGGVLGPTYIFGMAGGVVNNGTMTFNATGGVGGIVLVANLGSTFSGGIVNNGTINVSGTSGPTAITPFLGGPGAIVISSGITGQPAFAGGGTVTGGITNNGTLNVTGAGAAVGIGASFVVASTAAPYVIDAITNRGTININTTGSGGNGILLQDLVGGGSTLTVGAIANSGTINANNGIVVGLNTTVTNGITNTGTINGQVAISTANDGGATVINQQAGALNGAVHMSLVFFDTLNVTGGVVNGQVTGGAGTNLNLSGGAVFVAPTIVSQVGTYVQTGGALGIGVTPNAATHGDLTVFGQPTLGGTLGAQVQPGVYPNSTTYTGVLTAAIPFATQFAQVQAFQAGTTTPLAFFTASATYHPTAVDITLNRVPFGAAAGETPNERAVGNALESVFSPGLTGNAAAFVSAVLQATSPTALDQISGEGTSGTQETAFAAASLFTTLMMDQGNAFLRGTVAGSGVTMPALPYAARADAHPVFKAMAPPLYQPIWRAWVGGFGGSYRLDGNAAVGSADLTHNTAGGAFGLDYRTADWLAGFAVGGSSSSFSVPARATGGDLAAGHVGVYGIRKWGLGYTAASFSYAHFDNSTTRSIALPGASETATGSFGSDLLGGRIEAGWRNPFGRVTLTPFAAVQFAELWQQAYSETSVTSAGAPGVFGNSYAAKRVPSLPTFLGLQADALVALRDGMIWSPVVRVAWVHEFEPTRDVTATFLALPGAAFTVDGPRAARDAARIEAGSSLAVNARVSLFANFVGEFSDLSSTYAGTGGVKVTW
jgi:uncharacterized protein with beta-barrel porin domain